MPEDALEFDHERYQQVLERALDDVRSGRVSKPMSAQEACARIQGLTDKVMSEDAKTWHELHNLGDKRLKFPLMVSVEEVEGEYIANCPTFRLGAVISNSPEGALHEMCLLLESDLEAYLESYPDGLTDGAKDLLRLYCAYLGKDLPNYVTESSCG